MKNKNIYRHEIPKTLSQSIYNYLKESIIKNELKANQRINEKEIADGFSVSRTPVREALVRLAEEGFVDIISHREIVVKEILYEELIEIFKVVGILDSFATVSALDKLNPEDIIKLEDMTTKLEHHYHKKEIEKFITVNYAIHNGIWNRVPNSFLKKDLRYCVTHIRRYNNALNSTFYKSEILDRSMKAHREILEGLRTKNKKKLKTVVFEHWIPPLL